MAKIKVLGYELTEQQYRGFVEIARIHGFELWNFKSDEYKKGILEGILCATTNEPNKKYAINPAVLKIIKGKE